MGTTPANPAGAPNARCRIFFFAAIEIGRTFTAEREIGLISRAFGYDFYYFTVGRSGLDTS
jgi:hypothetical protein